MNASVLPMPSEDSYKAIFARERENSYPQITAFEHDMGHAIDKQDLEEIAFTLACPLKKNPPNWQHGRVIYTAAMRYLETHPSPVLLLDIGTAKGFSALVLAKALIASGNRGHVISVDIVDPHQRVRRNSVTEICHGFRTPAEYVAPWPGSERIGFMGGGSKKWFEAHPLTRVNFAVIDGKHTREAVSEELHCLTRRQALGDMIVIDDMQIGPVADAVKELSGYEFYGDIVAHEDRRYALARKL